jgi:hypothetical protein
MALSRDAECNPAGQEREITLGHRRHRLSTYNKTESTTLTTTDVARGKYTVVFFPRYKKSPGSRPKKIHPAQQHQDNARHNDHRTQPNQQLAQFRHN